MKHRNKRNSSPVYKDPVCGMETSHNTAQAVSTYEEETYYFCADICAEKFEENPDLYIHKFSKTAG